MQQLVMLSVKKSMVECYCVSDSGFVLSVFRHDFKVPRLSQSIMLDELGACGSSVQLLVFNRQTQWLHLALIASLDPLTQSESACSHCSFFFLLKFFAPHLIIKFRCISHSTNTLWKGVSQNLSNTILPAKN